MLVVTSKGGGGGAISIKKVEVGMLLNTQNDKSRLPPPPVKDYLVQDKVAKVEVEELGYMLYELTVITY